MAALTGATTRKYDAGVGPNFNHLIVKTGVTIYAGAAVAIELASGHLYVPVGNDAAEVFAGFADETVVGDGAKRCRVRSVGQVELSVTGLTSDDDFGKPVYAVTDADFSLTDSTADLIVGRIHRYVSGTIGVVHFAAGSQRGGDVPA